MWAPRSIFRGSWELLPIHSDHVTPVGNGAKLVIDAFARGKHRSEAVAGGWFGRSLRRRRTPRQYVGPMDESEKTAKSYLAYLGFEGIVYEPDGTRLRFAVLTRM